MSQRAGAPSGAMNALRRTVAESPVSRLLLRPGVRRVGATMLQARFLPAAFRLTNPWRFLWAEFRGHTSAAYRVRRSPSVLVVDHRHGGLELIAEIFQHGCYEPPPAIAAAIPERPRIVDLGANVGAFVAFAAGRWPGAPMTVVEPDPGNLELLRQTCQANRVDATIIDACAATEDGELRFTSGLGAGSLVSDDGEVSPAVDVLPLLQACDLAKIDIEGSEWPILADPRLTAIQSMALVMEFHTVGCPRLPAASAARDLLESAGFDVVQVDENYWGHGMLWAYKAPVTP